METQMIWWFEVVVQYLIETGRQRPASRSPWQLFLRDMSELWFFADIFFPFFFYFQIYFVYFFGAVNYGLLVCESLQYNSGIVLFTV